MPILPSEPNKTFCGLKPIDPLEIGSTWLMMPLGETRLIFSTISSILPYLFFFIPLAFVAIHPPTVDNSTLSGS